MSALLDRVRPGFRAAAQTFIPETVSAEPAEWDRLEAIVASALSDRPAPVRRQILLFIRILDLVSLARYARPLARLDPARRTRLLESLSASPILLIRRGMWGLRTLIQMGWYTQPRVQQRLGYRASPAGWSARR